MLTFYNFGDSQLMVDLRLSGWVGNPLKANRACRLAFFSVEIDWTSLLLRRLRKILNSTTFRFQLTQFLVRVNGLINIQISNIARELFQNFALSYLIRKKGGERKSYYESKVIDGIPMYSTLFRVLSEWNVECEWVNKNWSLMIRTLLVSLLSIFDIDKISRFA